jgi:predicted secreted protein
MGLKMAFVLFVALGWAALPAPLMAGDAKPKAAQDPKPEPVKDPNEKVCEKQSVLGSRLATRRVCATRAEWAESRRLDKEAIDLGQKSACLPSAGC